MRIAFCSRELSGAAPRGITRVARGFAEALVADGSHECWCVTNPVPRTLGLVCEVEPLEDWLSSRPLVDPRREPAWYLVAKWTVPAPILSRAAKACRWAAARLPRFGRPAPPPPRAATAMQLEDFDAFLVFEPYSDWLKFDLASVPLVTFIHDCIPLRIDEGGAWRPEEFRGAIRRACSQSRLLVCNSESTRRDVDRFFDGGSAEREVVVPFGHDRDRFRAAAANPERKDQVLERLGIDPKKNYFVLLGVVEDRKNVIGALRAFERLARTSDFEFEVLIVGLESGEGRFSELIRQVASYAPIRFLGYRNDDDVAAILSGASALVFVSLWEGYGIPLLEAMSAGTLVVTSNVSSMPEVAREHAFYCDPYDIDDIAARLSDVLSLSPEQRRARIASASSYAERFTWRNAARELLEHLPQAVREESGSL